MSYSWLVVLGFPMVTLAAILLAKYAVRQMEKGKKGW